MKKEKDHAFYSKLWSLMIPIVLQNLMLALVAVADAFMLGGMDQNYMSAVSLAPQIQFIQNMLCPAKITYSPGLFVSSVSSNGKSWNPGCTVLGERRYPNAGCHLLHGTSLMRAGVCDIFCRLCFLRKIPDAYFYK